MTVKELYDSVAQLGFETELEDEIRFYFAVNRAVLQVNRIRPAVSTYSLNHFPLENRLSDDTFTPVVKGDVPLVFTADGVKSYYFECNGNGLAAIEASLDGKAWETVKAVELASENGRFIAYRGLISEDFTGTVRIKFSGKYVYYVRNVAMYGALLSDGADAVPPYSRYTVYDVAELTEDFLSFANPPIADVAMDRGFVLNADYFVEGVGRLYIPSHTVGVFDIRYNRRVAAVSAEDARENTRIDLDDDLAAVLPNLVAGYIWLDDEPAKAEYYMALYREQAAELRAARENFSPAVYRNKNGW